MNDIQSSKSCGFFQANKFVKVCMQSKSVFTDYFLKGTNTNTKKKGGPPQEVKVKKERYHPYK